MKRYDNIQTITTGLGYDFTSDCLLDYPYFKQYHILIATDLCKQQALDFKQQVPIQKQNSRLILLGI